MHGLRHDVGDEAEVGLTVKMSSKMRFRGINGRLYFSFQVEIYIILRLMGCLQTIVGQPSEPLTMPSVVLKEAYHEVLSNKPALKEKPIDNKNPYQDRTPEVGGLTYPVIFEPVQNVEFSRSVYKITSIVDFSSYGEYFKKYEQYITKLYRDLRKEEKVKLITNPFKLLRERNYTTYLPMQLENVDCDKPEVCETNPHKDCYHWYVSICMSQKHYKHLLKETRHVKEVFDTLKGSFYEAINHQEENLEKDFEDRRMTRSLVRYEGMNREEASYLDETLTVLEMFRENETQGNQKRKKRFFAELGTFLAGVGTYVNYRNIQTIKENIEILHEENKRQDRAIGMLSRFLKIVDTRVRIHTKMLNSLNVALTQLQYKLMGTIYLSQYKSFTTYVLRDAGYAMTRLLSGLTATTQNIESIYAYLKIMNSHCLDPTVMPVSQLRELLKYVQQEIEGSPRLELPLELNSHDIQGDYNVIGVTALLTDDVLFIVMTIPLKDTSLQMNVYKVHNLPLIHPKLNISVTYELEGKYLAIGHEGHYVSLPEEGELTMCLLTQGGLCKMNQAMYPSDKVDWCIWALFIKDERMVKRVCTYNIQKRNGNLAQSLGGYLWAISSIAAEQIQVRCLKETYIVEIKAVLQIIFIGDGCEGYSPCLAIAAKTEITSSFNIDSRVRFFISFNTEYQDNELIGLWVEIPIGYLTKEELNDVVEQLPEREPLDFDDINSTILQLKEYPYEIKQWMILTALGVMAIVFIVTVVIIIWKVYHMTGALGQMGELFAIVKDKPNLSGLIEAGRTAQVKLQNPAPAASSNKETPIETPVKPEVAIPLYQAIGEEFTSEKQIKKYLSKMKKMKGERKSIEDSEGVTTDTT